jgi:hypothetical protein
MPPTCLCYVISLPDICPHPACVLAAHPLAACPVPISPPVILTLNSLPDACLLPNVPLSPVIQSFCTPLVNPVTLLPASLTPVSYRLPPPCRLYTWCLSICHLSICPHVT